MPAKLTSAGTMAARLESLVAVGMGVFGTVVVGAAVVPVVEVLDFELLHAETATSRLTANVAATILVSA